MPTLTVIAGPNGSGKSTLTSSFWFEGNANLIDPDAIARRLDAARPARSAIPAAREAILRCRALLADRASFILETTLAGHGAMGIIRQAVMPDTGRCSPIIRSAILSCTLSAYASGFLKEATIFLMPIFDDDTGAV